jgi:Tfp pilus assembly protein PilV
MTNSPRIRRGVSLIEALVALAVMAFGMLAVVGLQVTLRSNGDLSKQRAEAVRIAQGAIEDWRSIVGVTAIAGQVDYIDLKTDDDAVLVDDLNQRYNAVYTLQRTATPAPGNSPPMKTVQVAVAWTDRTGTSQTVRLGTVVAGVTPALAGTLAVPPSTLLAGSAPTGRNRNIPDAAVQINGGKSAFKPPQAAGGTVVWVFDNLSGLITTCAQIDLTQPLTAANIGSCSGEAQLVQGFVNFANPAILASATQAVEPTGPAFSVEVQVMRTAPSALLVGPGSGCFTSSPVVGQPYVEYFCAVPAVSPAVGAAPQWSGYSIVTSASLPAVPVVGGLSTCRYTSVRSDTPVPAIANVRHPRAYVDANSALLNQNFLIVRVVGNDATDCPDGAPLPVGQTTFPQPQTAP